MPCIPHPTDQGCFTVDLPAGNSVFFYGMSSAGWKQRVRASLNNSGHVSPVAVFDGQEHGLLKTDAGQSKPFTEYVVSVGPDARVRKIHLDFSAQPNNKGSYTPSKVKWHENIIPKYATYYTFNIEDGYDEDYFDTVFTIAILPNNKKVR